MSDDDSTIDSPTPDGGRRRKLKYTLLAVGLVLLLMEGGSSLLLAALELRHSRALVEEAHCRYDADLGWSHIPSSHRPDLYEEGASLTVNAQGFRAPREYAREVPEGTYRMICVGDSFTLGYGVDDDETYAAQLESLGEGLETVNMGQGGYGLDQAYLWYRRDGVELDCDLVLFAFIAHDFHRMESRDFDGHGKPWLSVKDGRLEVENVPAPKGFGSRDVSQSIARAFSKVATVRLADRLLRKLGPPPPPPQGMSLAFDRERAALVFDAMRTLCEERDQELVLAYFPIHPRRHPEPNEVIDWVRDHAREEGYSLIDLSGPFLALPLSESETYYRPDLHYTPRGNRLVAEHLLEELRQRLPDFPR